MAVSTIDKRQKDAVNGYILVYFRLYVGDVPSRDEGAADTDATITRCARDTSNEAPFWNERKTWNDAAICAGYIQNRETNMGTPTRDFETVTVLQNIASGKN